LEPALALPSTTYRLRSQLSEGRKAMSEALLPTRAKDQVVCAVTLSWVTRVRDLPPAAGDRWCGGTGDWKHGGEPRGKDQKGHSCESVKPAGTLASYIIIIL